MISGIRLVPYRDVTETSMCSLCPVRQLQWWQLCGTFVLQEGVCGTANILPRIPLVGRWPEQESLGQASLQPRFQHLEHLPGLSPCLQTLGYMTDSCLSHWGQSKWCMAGDDWKDHETSSYQLVTCAGRQQASNLAPFYGSASPASARCEWNCLGWCCPLSISLSAGSAGEAFHCGSWTLLSPWQPEIESGERNESNKWRKAKARQRTTKSRMCVKR